ACTAVNSNWFTSHQNAC
ncbi:DEAD/DEAH box helicase family protein, partial [Vibrio parahaemolyticus V-223/04]